MVEFINGLPASVLIGLFLIIINFPLGWIGLAFFIHLAKVRRKKSYYFIGAGLYLLSWVALFAGAFLCGEYYDREMFVKYRKYMIEGTVIIIIAVAFISRNFIKKASKINEKC